MEDPLLQERLNVRLAIRLAEQLAEALDRMEDVRDLWPEGVRGLPDLECAIDTARFARDALEEEGT